MRAVGQSSAIGQRAQSGAGALQMRLPCKISQ